MLWSGSKTWVRQHNLWQAFDLGQQQGSAQFMFVVFKTSCVLSCFSCGQPFATLWTVAWQTPLSMRFSRKEYWSGLPFHSPGHLPNPGIKPVSVMFPAFAGRFFTTRATWEVHLRHKGDKKLELKWFWKMNRYCHWEQIFGISYAALCGEPLWAFYCPLRLGKGNMGKERDHLMISFIICSEPRQITVTYVAEHGLHIFLKNVPFFQC